MFKSLFGIHTLPSTLHIRVSQSGCTQLTAPSVSRYVAALLMGVLPRLHRELKTHPCLNAGNPQTPFDDCVWCTPNLNRSPAALSLTHFSLLQTFLRLPFPYVCDIYKVHIYERSGEGQVIRCVCLKYPVASPDDTIQLSSARGTASTNRPTLPSGLLQISISIFCDGIAQHVLYTDYCA